MFGVPYKCILPPGSWWGDAIALEGFSVSWGDATAQGVGGGKGVPPEEKGLVMCCGTPHDDAGFGGGVHRGSKHRIV